MAKYDRSAHKRKETARIQMREPKTLEPLETYVTLHGPGSQRFIDASEGLRRRRTQLLRKYKREEAIPAEATAESYREFLADITDNIEGLEDNGQPLTFSRQVALDWYSDIDVVAQLNTELFDRTNF